MLKNLLLVAFRLLRKQPGFTAINLAGLGIGIASSILLLLYVRDELAFDRFHRDADRIFRVVEVRRGEGGTEREVAETAGPAGPALVREFPDVRRAVRIAGSSLTGRLTVSRGDRRFYEGGHVFTEPSFFELFDFELRRGDPAGALARAQTVVITEKAARRYFGDEDPMGQTLEVERLGSFEVTGVVADPPPNSHLDFSMLFSLATLQAIEGWRQWSETWDSDGFATYVALSSPRAAETLRAALPGFFRRHRAEAFGDARVFYLQPLADVHFGSSDILGGFNDAPGDRTYVYVFSALALFLLLIACFNYMNLATARSLRRAKEVGLRKVLGAGRGAVAAQFIGESFLFALGGLLLALALVELFLPSFNLLTGRSLSLGGGGATVPVGLGVLLVLVGVVAGSYPAFVLSGFRPVQALRGTAGRGGRADLLLKGLVVTQFSLSILMLIATIVVSRQMVFVRSKPLGFDREQLVVVDINNGDVRRSFRAVKEEFARVPGVRAVSVSSRVPGEWKVLPQVRVVPEGGAAGAGVQMALIGADEDFLETYGLRLASGRGFAAARPADSAAVLLNEAAVRQLGWENPLGRRIRVPEILFDGEAGRADFEAVVIGVVRDFHFRSLHEEIGPLVLAHRANPLHAIDYFTLRIGGAETAAVLDGLRRVGERFDPAHPFEYNFLDERLADFYDSERRTGRIFGLAAGLAVFIACLGLLGLAAYAAERRTKEIGVRKTLGASVTGIVMLLTRDFARLVLVAFAAAAPVGYLLMSRWLEGFAYHAGLGAGTFLAAGAAAGALASVTVGLLALRAALADPVKSLRYE